MNAYEYLLDYNIKPSVQRIAIMDYLLKHQTHPCIDEIYMAVNKDIPTLSKTTVYNTLKLFIEHGAARMLTIDERNVCFDGNVYPHAHFQCSKCGTIYDVPLYTEIKEIATLKENGFDIEETHFYYKGVCAECKKKMKMKMN